MKPKKMQKTRFPRRLRLRDLKRPIKNRKKKHPWRFPGYTVFKCEISGELGWQFCLDLSIFLVFMGPMGLSENNTPKTPGVEHHVHIFSSWKLPEIAILGCTQFKKTRPIS